MMDAVAKAKQHNEVTRRILYELVETFPEPEARLVALESIVVGVMAYTVKTGGDNEVFDVFSCGVRDQLAQMRLGPIETEGSA